MTAKLLGDRVLVKQLPKEETTKSGIILPDSINDDSDQKEGKIINIGNGDKVKLLGISINDRVIYNDYGSEKITIDGEELKILGHNAILAIIDTNY